MASNGKKNTAAAHVTTRIKTGAIETAKRDNDGMQH